MSVIESKLSSSTYQEIEDLQKITKFSHEALFECKTIGDICQTFASGDSDEDTDSKIYQAISKEIEYFSKVADDSPLKESAQHYLRALKPLHEFASYKATSLRIPFIISAALAALGIEVEYFNNLFAVHKRSVRPMHLACTISAVALVLFVGYIKNYPNSYLNAENLYYYERHLYYRNTRNTEVKKNLKTLDSKSKKIEGDWLNLYGKKYYYSDLLAEALKSSAHTLNETYQTEPVYSYKEGTLTTEETERIAKRYLRIVEAAFRQPPKGLESHSIKNEELDHSIQLLFSSDEPSHEFIQYHLDDKTYKVHLIHNPGSNPLFFDYDELINCVKRGEKTTIQPKYLVDLEEKSLLSNPEKEMERWKLKKHVHKASFKAALIADKELPKELLAHLKSLLPSSVTVKQGDFSLSYGSSGKANYFDYYKDIQING